MHSRLKPRSLTMRITPAKLTPSRDCTVNKAKSIAVYSHRFSYDNKSGRIVRGGIDVACEHRKTVKLRSDGRNRSPRTRGPEARPHA